MYSWVLILKFQEYKDVKPALFASVKRQTRDNMIVWVLPALYLNKDDFAIDKSKKRVLDHERMWSYDTDRY